MTTFSFLQSFVLPIINKCLIVAFTSFSLSPLSLIQPSTSSLIFFFSDENSDTSVSSPRWSSSLLICSNWLLIIYSWYTSIILHCPLTSILWFPRPLSYRVQVSYILSFSLISFLLFMKYTLLNLLKEGWRGIKYWYRTSENIVILRVDN